MTLHLRRAFLIAAMTVTAQVDRCSGCGIVVPAGIQHLYAPATVAARLHVAAG